MHRASEQPNPSDPSISIVRLLDRGIEIGEGLVPGSRDRLREDQNRERSELKKMKARRKEESQFAVCVADSESDLELRKVYEVLPDEEGAKENYLRIIDESGEDYLYPASFFVFVEVSNPAERALLRKS